MTTPPAEAERVRSYLVAQAAKLSLPQLAEKLRTDAAPLAELANAVPTERFRDEPPGGGWSAAQVWDHIVTTSETVARAIEAILESRTPPSAISDLIDAATKYELPDGPSYYREFNERREQLLERVLQASGDENLDVKVPHAWFGDLNWREWLLFLRIHDIDHIGQLREIAARLGGTA